MNLILGAIVVIVIGYLSTFLGRQRDNNNGAFQIFKEKLLIINAGLARGHDDFYSLSATTAKKELFSFESVCIN